MQNQQHIVHFVQHTLGCQCPSEVFNRIEYVTDKVLKEGLNLRSITIGERLLIYIWEIHDLVDIKAKLSALILAGKIERDQRGLNRLRVVIATDNVIQVIDTAQQIFTHFEHKDEKIHLHILNKQDIASF